MMESEQLLNEILAFCAATGMAETTFGQKAVHEWSLVKRLRDGRDIEMRTASRILEFIRENSEDKAVAAKRKRRRVA